MGDLVLQIARREVQGEKVVLESARQVGAAEVAHVEREEVGRQAPLPSGQGMEGAVSSTEAQRERYEAKRVLQRKTVRAKSARCRSNLEAIPRVDAAQRGRSFFLPSVFRP